MLIESDPLETIVGRFRAAILSLPPDVRSQLMPWFPLGSCDFASLLLGAYLTDNSFGSFDLVGGESTDDEQKMHCWLERDGIVIDITADQFPDGPASVIVGPETRWHLQYVNRIREVGDFRLNGRARCEKAHTLYARLCSRLKARVRRQYMRP